MSEFAQITLERFINFQQMEKELDVKRKEMELCGFTVALLVNELMKANSNAFGMDSKEPSKVEILEYWGRAFEPKTGLKLEYHHGSNKFIIRK